MTLRNRNGTWKFIQWIRYEVLRHPCRFCSCCWGEWPDDTGWMCSGCFANYGKRRECEDCPRPISSRWRITRHE